MCTNIGNGIVHVEHLNGNMTCEEYCGTDKENSLCKQCCPELFKTTVGPSLTPPTPVPPQGPTLYILLGVLALVIVVLLMVIIWLIRKRGSSSTEPDIEAGPERLEMNPTNTEPDSNDSGHASAENSVHASGVSATADEPEEDRDIPVEPAHQRPSPIDPRLRESRQSIVSHASC